MNLFSFFINLLVKADTLKLNDFIRSIGQLNVSSVLTSLGLGGMYEGLKKIMSIGDEAGVSMSQFAAQTGLSSEQMQQFAVFTESMGAKAGSAKQSLIGLQQAMFDVALGRGNAEPFNLIGLAPEQDVFSFLDKLHNKLKDIASPTMRNYILSNLNISTDIAKALGSSDEVWNSYKKIQVLGDNDVKALLTLHTEMVRIGNDMTTFWSKIAADLAGPLDVIDKGIVKITDKMAGAKGAPLRHYFEAGALGAAGVIVGMVPGLQIPAAAMIGTAGGMAFNQELADLSQTIKENQGKTVTQTVTVKVDGAQDPQAVARAVRDHIQGHLSDAFYNDSSRTK